MICERCGSPADVNTVNGWPLCYGCQNEDADAWYEAYLASGEHADG